jgi:hypothetical protein
MYSNISTTIIKKMSCIDMRRRDEASSWSNSFFSAGPFSNKAQYCRTASNFSVETYVVSFGSRFVEQFYILFRSRYMCVIIYAHVYMYIIYYIQTYYTLSGFWYRARCVLVDKLCYRLSYLSTKSRVGESIAVGESMSQWVGESVSRWVGESMSRWVDESICRWVRELERVCEFVSRWNGESVHWWVGALVSRWVIESVSRWVGESIDVGGFPQSLSGTTKWGSTWKPRYRRIDNSLPWLFVCWSKGSWDRVLLG